MPLQPHDRSPRLTPLTQGQVTFASPPLFLKGLYRFYVPLPERLKSCLPCKTQSAPGDKLLQPLFTFFLDSYRFIFIIYHSELAGQRVDGGRDKVPLFKGGDVALAILCNR